MCVRMTAGVPHPLPGGHPAPGSQTLVLEQGLLEFEEFAEAHSFTVADMLPLASLSYGWAVHCRERTVGPHCTVYE